MSLIQREEKTSLMTNETAELVAKIIGNQARSIRESEI